VRQPLRRALLLHPGVELGEELRRQVADELNVKALEDVESLSGLMSWSIVPNFRALGPRLGARVNQVKQALAEADGGELREALERQGWVEVAGCRLEPGDVEVRAHGHQDFAVAHDGGWAVALDLELDDDLRVEGVARELVRRLNDLRKDRQLAITDRIALQLYDAGPGTRAAVDAHHDWIAGEVLAEELDVTAGGGDGAGSGASLDVDGEQVRVRLRVLGRPSPSSA
jgi:isoleucyl-tRNA synthetase